MEPPPVNFVVFIILQMGGALLSATDFAIYAPCHLPGPSSIENFSDTIAANQPTSSAEKPSLAVGNPNITLLHGISHGISAAACWGNPAEQWRPGGVTGGVRRASVLGH